MTAEQIMAANPDISEHAAAALAEKFKSEAANNASEDKLKMALQQKDEMRSFMENMMQQQMSMQQNMMNNMRDVAVGSQQKQAELIKAKDDELNRTVQSSKENQDRYVDAMKTTVNAMANIHKAPPVTNVNARINPNAGVNTGISAQKSAAGVKVCPGCGANNPEDATFCEECGSSL
ncbi:MAG: zinc ribbon domain-containing protein [Treponema sp.]|nr:zinc ribbon domain-containing protein [Spirochaetia bacterium]MDD7459805.1 zinc ribbon domain-containing protein [Spirochaetales bacterium]MDY5812159.1 zinc ribbon domain-containing protein [Treponema sp.]